jgi:DNA-binding FadR family transcriptional regulator
MKAAANGADDPLEADVQFHVAILRATGNPFFLQFEEMVRTALHTSIHFTNRFAGRTADIAEHEDVLDAIRAGDPDRARTAMCGLIGEVLCLIAQAQAHDAGIMAAGTARPAAAVGP